MLSSTEVLDAIRRKPKQGPPKSAGSRLAFCEKCKAEVTITGCQTFVKEDEDNNTCQMWVSGTCEVCKGEVRMEVN